MHCKTSAASSSPLFETQPLHMPPWNNPHELSIASNSWSARLQPETCTPD
ncbi:hypothetical protein ACE6H2_028350 [Prunus campanulata]